MEAFDKIYNIDDMVEWVARELGHPEINVELKPETIKQQIYNSRHEYLRYAGGEGYYQDYFVVKLPANCSEIKVKDLVDANGDKIDEDIDYIYSFDTSSGMGGINELFTPTHLLLGGQAGGGGGLFQSFGSGSGMMLAEYETAMMYLEDVKRAFGKSYQVRFIPGKEVIKVTPAPKMDVIGVLSAYNNQKLDDMFNLVNFRKLCVANTGYAWGHRLRKNTVQFPDGSSVGGGEIKSDYQEMLKDIREIIEAESEGFDIIVA